VVEQLEVIDPLVGVGQANVVDPCRERVPHAADVAVLAATLGALEVPQSFAARVEQARERACLG
jgi:hypothetical protein